MSALRAKSRLTWNSDSIANKKQLVREKPKLTLSADGADSQKSSDVEQSHESFPIHGLGDEAGYEAQLASVAVDGMDGEASSAQPILGSTKPKSAFDGLTGQTIPKILAEFVRDSDTAHKKVLLPPDDVSSNASVKAELVRDAILAAQETDGSIAEVVIGERITELDHFCEYFPRDDRDETYVERVLHRERTVDVRVVKSVRFGEVVQKTYLKQTMRMPFRPHSCMKDQLLYEASIVKSLTKSPGVIRLLGWYHFVEPLCQSFGCEQHSSLLYEYIGGDHSPTEAGEIFAYMTQLLTTLDHMHCRGIVHCNMKRENVLFDGSKLTVIDFETAVNEHERVDMGAHAADGKVQYCSNPSFSAPEVLQSQPGRSKHGRGVLYGHRRDVWGAGIILAELLLRLDPQTHLFPQVHTEFPQVHTETSIRARFDFCGLLAKGSILAAFKGLKVYGDMPSTKFHKHGADLVKHMTLWSRFKRARAWEALQHSFFTVDPKDTTVEPDFEMLCPERRPLYEEQMGHALELEYLFSRRSPSPDMTGDGRGGLWLVNMLRKGPAEDLMIDPVVIEAALDFAMLSDKSE